MEVRELMTREVRTCRAEDSVNEAARIMWESDCGSVPVVDTGSRLVGMVTDRDVCMAAYTQGQRLDAIPVASAMSTQVYTCRPSDGLAHVAGIMRDEQVRRLPVVDADGRLVGILSLNDLARRAIDERHRGAGGITLDEVGWTLGGVSATRACALQPRQGQGTQESERELVPV